MKLKDFPEEVQQYLIPEPTGDYFYRCLGCGSEYAIDTLLYVCPQCKGVLMIEDRLWNRLKNIEGPFWRKIFDFRSMLTEPSLRGIYRFHELLGSILPRESIIYLGEGHTPVVSFNNRIKDWLGLEGWFKNDGQNPSASFKDRGMASAFSYLNYLVRRNKLRDVLAVCASTGDTSAAAALYASYLVEDVASVVLLPKGKVTPQQLAQPLGSGATVIEVPGVFDDAMKVVEYLSEHYPVALMNSKNAWRILGQESYSFEIAQQFDYDLEKLAVVVPIGNAGNITAVLNGFLKLKDLKIITALPVIVGVQSEHANPVYLYYLEKDPKKRVFKPLTVKPSVAQAAMIGNPVSMPRVIELVQRYRDIAGSDAAFQVVAVKEQEIMDAMLRANRNGHVVCTQGGECLAGIKQLLKHKDLGSPVERVVLDATAHALKFAVFQDKYFSNSFDPEYEIVPKKELQNYPVTITMPEGIPSPSQGKKLSPEEFQQFVIYVSKKIANLFGLKDKDI